MPRDFPSSPSLKRLQRVFFWSYYTESFLVKSTADLCVCNVRFTKRIHTTIIISLIDQHRTLSLLLYITILNENKVRIRKLDKRFSYYFEKTNNTHEWLPKQINKRTLCNHLYLTQLRSEPSKSELFHISKTALIHFTCKLISTLFPELENLISLGPIPWLQDRGL